MENVTGDHVQDGEVKDGMFKGCTGPLQVFLFQAKPSRTTKRERKRNKMTCTKPNETTNCIRYVLDEDPGRVYTMPGKDYVDWVTERGSFQDLADIPSDMSVDSDYVEGCLVRACALMI